MRNRASVLAAILAALSVASVQARVERVEILSRSDVLDGKAFGDAGGYEKIIGKIHFAVKPDDPPNKLIVDLDKAPRNAADRLPKRIAIRDSRIAAGGRGFLWSERRLATTRPQPTGLRVCG